MMDLAKSISRIVRSNANDRGAEIKRQCIEFEDHMLGMTLIPAKEFEYIMEMLKFGPNFSCDEFANFFLCLLDEARLASVAQSQEIATVLKDNDFNNASDLVQTAVGDFFARVYPPDVSLAWASQVLAKGKRSAGVLGSLIYVLLSRKDVAEQQKEEARSLLTLL